MSESLKPCLFSHLNQARKLLINFSNKLTSCNNGGGKSQAKKLITSELTSCFASMEASSQLKQVFKFIDTNGDGKISPLELKEVLVSLGDEKGKAEEEAEGIVREMDFDGDGYVDLDEFMVVMGNDLNSVVMEAFKVFDCDNNGLISDQELQRVLGRLGCGNCSLKKCRKMIEGVDRDGDGFVNFDEFKFMMSLGY